ncbi:MAG: hypothetical protein LKE83_11875 [Erysipelotrichaceae bacterium]|nr:hypothetical protein [Erysipelotrichaceae bacterium]
MNDNLNACVPEVCPVCGAEHVRFYRRDIHGKKRRWCCSKWKHKFTDDSHTITSNLNIERDVFVQICMETLDMVPIRKDWQNGLMSLFSASSTIVIRFSAFWKRFSGKKRN